MDLLSICVLLFTVLPKTISTDIVPPEDFLQRPMVYRNCVERQCPCGTEPKICEEENGEAECVQCDEGEFQEEVLSTRIIIDAKRCKAHSTCSEGWWYVVLVEFVDSCNEMHRGCNFFSAGTELFYPSILLLVNF